MSETLYLIGGAFLQKLIDDNLPSFNIRHLFKKQYKIDSEGELQITRNNSSLYPLYILSCMPNFNNKCYLQQECRNAFYNVAIRLVKDFEFTDSQRLTYIAQNFELYNLSHKSELLNFLHMKLNNPSDYDYSYKGFRSIYVILNDNIRDIDTRYIYEINKQLQPFFKNYKYSELFLSQLGVCESPFSS